MRSAVQEFEEMLPKLLNYTQNGKNIEIQIAELEGKLKEGTEKVLAINKQIGLHSKALFVLNQLIQTLSDNHVRRVESLITSALKTIFYDRDYTFEILVTDRGAHGKQAEMFLVEKIDGVEIKSPIKDGVGGGIQSIVGFVFQIFYIEHLRASKVLFLDESLSQVSSQYIEGVTSFIKMLSEENGFRFVLITHDSRLIPYADHIITVDKGKVVCNESN